MRRQFLRLAALAALSACGSDPDAEMKPPATPVEASPAPPPTAPVMEEPIPSNALPPILQQDPLVVRMTPNRIEKRERELYIAERPGAEVWFPFLWDETPQANQGARRTILALQPRSVELRAEGDVTVKELDLLVRQLAADGLRTTKVVLAPSTPPPETEPPAVQHAREKAAKGAEVLRPLEVPPSVDGALPSNLVEQMELAATKKVPSLGAPEMQLPLPQK